MGYIKPIPNNLTVRQRLKLAAPGNVVVVEGLTIYKDGRDWGKFPALWHTQSSAVGTTFSFLIFHAHYHLFSVFSASPTEIHSLTPGDRRETFNKFAAAYEGDGMRKYSVPLPGGQRGRLIAYSSDQYLPAKQVIHRLGLQYYPHAYYFSENDNIESPMYHSEEDIQATPMTVPDCYYERYERYERGVSAETQVKHRSLHRLLPPGLICQFLPGLNFIRSKRRDTAAGQKASICLDLTFLTSSITYLI